MNVSGPPNTPAFAPRLPPKGRVRTKPQLLQQAAAQLKRASPARSTTGTNARTHPAHPRRHKLQQPQQVAAQLKHEPRAPVLLLRLQLPAPPARRVQLTHEHAELSEAPVERVKQAVQEAGEAGGRRWRCWRCCW